MKNITLAITCCGRVDLLIKTIESISRHDDLIFSKKIIIDDSGNKAVGEKLNKLFGDDFQVILNEENEGQIASIDKMYSEISTEYIFHCEEDWDFYRGGFLETSVKILESYPDITVVALRDWDDDVAINCNMLKGDELFINDQQVGYKLFRKEQHNWSGFTFNPGLRRLKDYIELHNYTTIGQEEDISLFYLNKGRNIAILKSGCVSHIGWDEHVYTKYNPYDSYLSHKIPKPMMQFYQKVKKFIKKYVMGK